MANKKKVIDPLPDSFATAEAAGEFWDNHGVANYLDNFEPAKDKIKLERRGFEISVSEDVFNVLRKKARTAHKSLPKMVDQILRKELVG